MYKYTLTLLLVGLVCLLNPVETVLKYQNRAADDATAGEIQKRRQRICTREDIRLGSWIPVALVRPPYIPFDSTGIVSKCYPTTDDHYLLYNTSWETHQWKPANNCTYYGNNFDPFQMCAMLDNQTIVLIGDSKIGEFSTSFLYQMLPCIAQENSTPPLSPEMIHPRTRNDRVLKLACHKPSTNRSHTSSLSTFTVVIISSVDLKKMPTSLETYNPTILILSRGPHYVPTEQLRQDLVDESIPSLQKYVSRKPNTKIFWKTNEPGVPGCSNPENIGFYHYDKPATNKSAVLGFILNHSNPDFHWSDFESQNQLVESLLLFNSSSNNTQTYIPSSNVQILDGFDVLLLAQPDLHLKKLQIRPRQPPVEDCMHFCLPGPQDALPRLFYHYMYVEYLERQDR